jgi:tetratricopeptide (TPR) repeat protein
VIPRIPWLGALALGVSLLPAAEHPRRPLVQDEIPPPVESFVPGAALIARGNALLDQASRGPVNLASEMFGHAFEIDPNSADAAIGSARVAVLRYTRRWVEDDDLIDLAARHARFAVEARPDDAAAHAALAAALFIAEDAAGAIEEAERSWSLRRVDTPPWVGEIRAQMLIARGDPEEALRILDEARPAHPGRFQNYYLTGSAHLEAGRLEEANASFRRALLLDPNFTPALLQLAYTLDRAQNMDVASQTYMEIVRRFPEEKARVSLRLASSLVSRRRYADALKLLEPTEIKTRRGLGAGTVAYLKAVCLEKTGRKEEARALYRTVVDDYPRASYGTMAGPDLASASFEAMARMDLEAGRQEEAVRLMEEALGRERTSVQLYLALARVYADYGLKEEAARILERGSGIDFGPRQAGTKVALYVAWARALRPKDVPPDSVRVAKVLQALDKDTAVLLDSGEVVHLLEAARACALLDEPARGVEWIRRAMERGYARIDWVKDDPEMASISREPGFAALRKSEGS